MITGASNTDLSLILVDARKGMTKQTRRHAFISSLLRIPHMVVAVNKMDLVGYDEDVFEEIIDDFTQWAAKLDVGDLTFIPISALVGDNVVDRSEEMGWYEGPAALSPRARAHRPGSQHDRLPSAGAVGRAPAP